MSHRTRTTTKTVKATREGPKPKLPKVDKPQVFENATRMLFTASVDEWCRDNIDGRVEKEIKGQAVDDLLAKFGSAIDTLVTAATDTYLDAALDDDEDDDDDDDNDDEGDDDDD